MRKLNLKNNRRLKKMKLTCSYCGQDIKFRDNEMDDPENTWKVSDIIVCADLTFHDDEDLNKLDEYETYFTPIQNPLVFCSEKCMKKAKNYLKNRLNR